MHQFNVVMLALTSASIWFWHFYRFIYQNRRRNWGLLLCLSAHYRMPSVSGDSGGRTFRAACVVASYVFLAYLVLLVMASTRTCRFAVRGWSNARLLSTEAAHGGSRILMDQRDYWAKHVSLAAWLPAGVATVVYLWFNAVCGGPACLLSALLPRPIPGHDCCDIKQICSIVVFLC